MRARESEEEMKKNCFLDTDMNKALWADTLAAHALSETLFFPSFRLPLFS